MRLTFPGVVDTTFISSADNELTVLRDKKDKYKQEVVQHCNELSHIFMCIILASSFFFVESRGSTDLLVH